MKPWLETWTIDTDYACYLRVGETKFADFDWTPLHAANTARLRLAAAAPALVRLLLRFEWSRNGGDCFECDGGSLYPPGHPEHNKHDPECPVDAALTAAGLPDQASRVEARREIEGKR